MQGVRPGAGAAAGGDPPPQDSLGGAGALPMGAPMSTPQQPEGQKLSAITSVQIAIELLEQALGPLGSTSPEGAAVLSALTKLSSKFGKGQGRDLIPAELMQMMGQVNQPPPQAPGPGGGQQPGA